jgi:hypothetical protein
VSKMKIAAIYGSKKYITALSKITVGWAHVLFVCTFNNEHYDILPLLKTCISTTKFIWLKWEMVKCKDSCLVYTPEKLDIACSLLGENVVDWAYKAFI